MAEAVKEFVPHTIADLLPPGENEDPDTPYYAKFYNQPIMEKLRILYTLGKDDLAWQKMSDDERKGFIQQHKLILPEEAPAPAGTITTGETLRNPPTQEELRGPQSLLSSVGRGGAALVSGALGAPADILNLPHTLNAPVAGLAPRIPLGAQDIAKKLGVPNESMNLLERTLQTVGGAITPGAFLRFAAQAGILPAVAQRIAPYVTAGLKTDAALGVTAQAGQEVGAAITPGSSTGPIIGGITAPLIASTVPSLVRAGRRTLAVAKFSPETQRELMTQKGTEAFEGPSLSEQRSGGTITHTAQEQLLDNFLQAQKQPVLQAQATTQVAELRKTGTEAFGRAQKTAATQQMRAIEDTATTEVRQVHTNYRILEDRIIRERQTAAQATRQLQEQGLQLDEQTTQQLRAAEQTSRTNLAALEQEKRIAQDQYTQTMRAAQDQRTTVQVQARTANKTARQQLESLQETLDRVTLASEKDINDSLAHAQKNVETLAPEMTQAGRQRGDVGRSTVRVAGEASQEAYAMIRKRRQDNFGAMYDRIYREYGITEPADTLYAVVQKYKAQLQPESVPTQEVMGSFAPRSAIYDFEQAVSRLAAEQQLGDAFNYADVMLDLPTIQSFRSRLLDDIAHTQQSSQRRGLLSRMYNEVNEVIENIAEKNPEAFDLLKETNRKYSIEIHREIGGPGHFALARNPLTREPLHTPDEVARNVFGVGPGVAKGSTIAAQHEANFTRYINDLDAIIAGKHYEGSVPGVGLVEDVSATLADAAAARNAKERLFDMVRVQFYDAAIDASTGTYVPQAAEKWLRDRGALINSHPDLKKLFQTPRDRIEAIREVRAKAQGMQALPQSYVEGMQETLKQIQATGGEQVAQARQTSTAGQRQAADVRTTTTRDIESLTGVEDEVLRLEKERLADIQSTQSAVERRQGFTQAEVGERTGEDITRAARQRADELEQARLTARSGKRIVADEAARQTEHERLATEALENAQRIESEVLADYKRTFGGSKAAESALLEDVGERALGSRPMDIVLEIQDMPQGAQNRAWTQWMRKASGNYDAKSAILQARWRAFLGPDGVADSAKAADFIQKNETWLTRYYPQYLNDIKRVQRAFTELEKLTENAPYSFSTRSIFRLGGIAGGVTYLSHVLGLSWKQAVGAGLATEAATYAMYRRKIAALSHIYLDPSDLHVIRRSMNPGASLNDAKMAAYRVFTRSGIFARESVDEEQPQ